MASQAGSLLNGLSGTSVDLDPAFWAHDPSDSSSLALHFSPTTSSTTQESLPGSTPPAQTPKSDSAQNGQQPQARTSVAVACVPCRSRHLKCDGGVRCSRCKTENVECTYIKSRRGWKGKRKAKVADVNGSPVNTSLAVTNLVQLPSPEYGYQLNTLSTTPTNIITVPATATTPTVRQYNLDGTRRPLNNGTNAPRDALSAFFFYFYRSHPFCLPRQRLLQLFKERRAPLLEFAVQYIGSSYLPSVPTTVYEQALERSIVNHTYSKDGFSLQALLLYAIGLHAHNKVPRAAQVFGIAQSLTLELGLHRREFALLHGNGDRVLEECWRRTWWSMYVVNGMMTAVNPGVQFRLKDVPLEVPLPCEDEQYFSEQIFYPHTLQEFDDDPFMGTEPITFSSFAYLIDAIRILGKVFEVARLDSTFEYHAVDVVDTYLCNWRNNLPVSKQDIVSNDGTLDELLFQAHMVNNGSTIMLHRPRSNLGFGEVNNVNICVQPGQILLPTQTREIHTAKCLTSAENISSLIKLPGPLLHHTPFFTCVVVMASVVHLSYWSFLVPDGQDDVIKQSIRLDVGTLQQYSATWPIASVVLGQVRGVAHTLWNSKKAMSIHLWSNIAHDDVIRNVIEEGGQEPLENYSQLIAP
ncbi:hypothetical protein M011DRAFT_394715 [Sporormia fimetaria CBS 119925]|uniref:Zn(2)-C6 fungal-type domain-containing protein n=1 Tax=Sporormia fimetaria CBS 119925 TaxID=1340428 RepID=A0A6A6VLY3_9PLEO|nr:hypothetical protein M011DRAFT_394715 [Sporormia fimetaria CBS 119925]